MFNLHTDRRRKFHQRGKVTNYISMPSSYRSYLGNNNLVVGIILACFTLLVACTSSPDSLVSKPRKKIALPRSVHVRAYSDGESPLWNPSSQIDSEGFLMNTYVRIPSELEVGRDAIGGRYRASTLRNVPVCIRQVPGDGNCLFHALTVCLTKIENGTHFCFKNNLEELRAHSKMLRENSVDYLSENPNRLLYLQGREYMRACDLIETAASPYGCTPEEYGAAMRQESFWGGGPEVVALCNKLQRPIHIYELHPVDKSNDKEGRDGSDGREDCNFQLRRMACFGSPKFDRKEALHILSADSRFPDVIPGKHLAAGNHFMALFPLSEIQNIEKRKRVRGGGGGGSKFWLLNSNIDFKERESFGSGQKRLPWLDRLITFLDIIR
jgi:OTU-like cysteine protease